MYIHEENYELELLLVECLKHCTNSKQEDFFWNVFYMFNWKG